MNEKGVIQKDTAREKSVKRSLSYRGTLDSVSKLRYDDKLDLIRKDDPYQIEKGKWESGRETWKIGLL